MALETRIYLLADGRLRIIQGEPLNDDIMFIKKELILNKKELKKLKELIDNETLDHHHK